jgi:hypothetical protein
LDLRRAFNRFDHAVELDQDAVADELYDAAAVPFDRRRDQLGPVA